MRTSLAIAATTIAFIGNGAAIAQEYDFNWRTIGNPGNAPFLSSNPDDSLANGHGRVDYEYRASQLEITTAQWMEFLNAFAPLDDSPLDHRGPLNWGAFRDDQLPNGHYVMSLDPIRSQAAMLPVGGISWRDAARYCNWLQSSKQVSLAAIRTGAYDTTTWGVRDPDTGFYPDAVGRMPGARFFLPTLDEYLKANYYDPNRFGPDAPGYWRFNTSSNVIPLGGPPGTGQTNAGYLPGGDPHAAWNIPLGAYPGTQTPWGLLDASGGGSEWIESFPTLPAVSIRPSGGSYAGMTRAGEFQPDYVGFLDGASPTSDGIFYSFRVYSAIPCPNALTFGLTFFSVIARRKRN